MWSREIETWLTLVKLIPDLYAEIESNAGNANIKLGLSFGADLD